MNESDFDEWLSDRNAALLTGDLGEINKFAKKWKQPQLPFNRVGLMAMHKARTACLALPDIERQKSRDWLLSHGSRPLG